MKNSLTNWRMWLRGVVGAIIGGAANGITVMLVKPEDFNFAAGFGNLWHVALVSGIVSAALYLKQHPVPDNEDTGSGPTGTGNTLSLILLCGLAATMGLGLTGCGTLDKTGPYSGDKVLYIADQSEVVAFKTIHAFVTFEFENRAALAAHPEIKQAADDMRRNAPDWFAQYDKARKVYVDLRSEETRAMLDATLKKITDTMKQATAFLFQSQTLVTK